jgi:hypothetical protein
MIPEPAGRKTLWLHFPAISDAIQFIVKPYYQIMGTRTAQKGSKGVLSGISGGDLIRY